VAKFLIQKRKILFSTEFLNFCVIFRDNLLPKITVQIGLH